MPHPDLRPLLAGLAALPLCFLACTTELAVQPVSTEPASGQVYFLPRTEVGIELERELTKCKVADPTSQQLAVLWIKEQAKRLGKADDAYRRQALLSRSPYCKEHRAEVEEALGALSRVFQDTSLESGVGGSKTREQVQLEYNRGLSQLLRSVLNDANFRSIGGQPVKIAVELANTLDDPSKASETVNRLLTMVSALEIPKADVDFDVEIRASVTPYFLADTSRAYTIDYQGTKRGFKRTEYTVETYDNGTLKSINVTLDDQTGQFIRSAVRGTLSLAAAASGFPLTLPAAAEAESFLAPEPFQVFRQAFKKRELCVETIQSLLAERAALDKELGQLPSQIRALNTALEEATEELTEAEKALTKAKADGTTGDALKPFEQAVTAKKDAKKKAADDLAAKEKEAEPTEVKRTKIRRALTIRSMAHFDPGAQDLPRQMVLPGEREAKGWFTDWLAEFCQESLECSSGGNQLPIDLLAWAGLYLAPGTQPENKAAATSGVVYRQPARGLLLVCSKQACLDAQGRIQALSDGLVLSQPLTVPQLGILASLPLLNKSFQNSNLQATFSESGTLTKVVYTSNARAVAAAQAFEGAAEDIVAFIEAKREEEKAKLEAEADEVNAEKDLVAAQLALEQERKRLEDFRSGKPVDSEGEEEEDEEDNADGGGDGDGDGNNGQ